LDRWILAIADDLTGALEVGAKFAGGGHAARVMTATETIIGPPDVPVLVVDTESRHLPEMDARVVVRHTAERVRNVRPWLVYKKTDSTLRGNIAAELRGLLDVFPEQSIVYAPAYPAMGRVVRSGRLLVYGVPVHETAFANDPLNPIRDSHVRTALGTVPAVVVDGESDSDIREVARRACGSQTPPLLVGPAALAGALVDFIPLSRGHVQPVPRMSRCLVVNGSLHPVAAAQIEFARDRGCFENGWLLFEHDGLSGAGVDRALRTGELVHDLLAKSPMDAVVVFGGDTAFGIHHAFGAPTFDSYGEVYPGVPLSRCGDLFWITKAGGFGDRDLLCEIRRRLT
jgi:D-threonate/D-erythronate kinase